MTSIKEQVREEFEKWLKKEEAGAYSYVGDVVDIIIPFIQEDTRKRLLEVLPGNKKASGTLLVNGNEADLKLHSDMSLGYNTGLEEARQAIINAKLD